MIGTDCGSGFPTCKVPGEYIGRLACLRLDDGKAYYSDAEEVNKLESEDRFNNPQDNQPEF